MDASLIGSDDSRQQTVQMLVRSALAPTDGPLAGQALQRPAPAESAEMSISESSESVTDGALASFVSPISHVPPAAIIEDDHAAAALYAELQASPFQSCST